MIRKILTNQKYQLIVPLLLVIAFLLATGVFVVEAESIRIVPIFIFLYLIGNGVMLGMGLSKGGMIGLLMITLWIAAKQVTGIWSAEPLLTSSVEVILMGGTFYFCGVLYARLGDTVDSLLVAQWRLEQLDFEDTAVGLIKPSIGMLRLKEEEDRSTRFHRPFALVLIKISPLAERDNDPGIETAVMRAIATTVKDTVRQLDFPFLSPVNRIAVILPEADNYGAKLVLDRICEKTSETQFITPLGRLLPVQEYVQIHFGLAIFTGSSEAKIDALEAAEQSLQNDLISNTQNLFSNAMIIGKGKEPAWAVKNQGMKR